MFDWSPLVLSVELATVTTFLLLLTGIPLAWWLVRRKTVVRRAAYALVALPLALPPTVLGFYLLLALGPHGPLGAFAVRWFGASFAFTFTGLVIASMVYSLPLVVQPLTSGFERLDAHHLETAALLGAGPWDRLVSVVLPLLRADLLTAAVLGFIHTFGEFGVVLMVGGDIPGRTRVLSLAIYDHVQALEYHQADLLSAVAVGMSFTALLLLYLITQRRR
ncbi:MAG TPA: molybdate ABC transporter permease subunit [Gammaproteobacteria bacterium]|nr:molybdate ABC transporter permease subunit [Gammaproteobacteria bacterium]